MKLADEIIMYWTMYCQNTCYEIVIPNFYVGRYEMDVFRRMKSGYVVEYEIKISKSDFLNDFNKCHTEYKGRYPDRQYFDIKKHDLLKLGNYPANRFYFVVPKGLLTIEDIPEYAGLIEYHRESKHFETVKTAPLMHKNKLDDKTYFENLATSLSFRENRQRMKIFRLKHQIKTIKKGSF